MINLSLFIMNNLLGYSKLIYKDFMLFVIFVLDWEVVVVLKDLNIENVN